MDRHIPLNVARAVILGDIEFLRFERFCNDIVSAMEGGRPILSTSLTYDRGRDGQDCRSETAHIRVRIPER